MYIELCYQWPPPIAKEGWNVLPKLSAVGALIAVMKSLVFNKTPKTTLGIADFFSDHWIKTLGFGDIYNAKHNKCNKKRTKAIV